MFHSDSAARKRNKRKQVPRRQKEEPTEDLVTREFNEELRCVYRDIDKHSSLLWSHDNGLVRPKRRSIKSASKEFSYCEDSLAGRSRTRGKSHNTSQAEPDWQTDSTAQIGYGEITKGAMQKFLQILQNIDQAFKAEHEPYLKFKKEEYRLTSDDTFIDIGSGFGKPVFHAAMQVGCFSKGIEIVPARVEYCIDFVFEYEASRKTKIIEAEK